MENSIKLVNPELLILVPVLNAVGTMLKKSRFPNDGIPLCLGLIGIALCCLHGYATAPIQSWSLFFYQNITQGLLIAAASVYSHQIYCQSSKKK